MRFRGRNWLYILFLVASSAAADPWPAILGSVGASAETANIHVVPNAPESWLAKIEQGAIVVIEGTSPLAGALGIRPGNTSVSVRSVVDLRRPRLEIVWEKAAEVPVYELPPSARIFARERRSGAPLMAGVRRGKGAVLWLATSPGTNGYERFPYALQALADLGFDPLFRGNDLWAFFDSSYRSRVDFDYFAARWRKSGFAALHIAAWHYWEPDPARDEYLRQLIDACHRNAILVYAWLELPHVSERFWEDHPEWREKTGLLQDAHLDWRKLMNLQNAGCRRAVASGLRRLIGSFEWDGVNLAELYFESLEGAANPARFTPFNDDVRRDFRAKRGVDPIDLLTAKSDPRPFLDYRAELARGMQREWLTELEAIRSARPGLDLVLTHIDDRFDTRMRDLLGADSEQVLPLLDQHDFTFLIEDPATVWHLGPQRYPQIAREYRRLTPHARKLAIDINVTDRYQDVYPTKQQTGTELFQLVHLSSEAFERVALYFENSILPDDLPLLPAAAARAPRIERAGEEWVVDAPSAVGIKWSGPAMVNGKRWPVTDGSLLWLPAGQWRIQTAQAAGRRLRILDCNCRLTGAEAMDDSVAIAYDQTPRALAVLDAEPGRLEIDDRPAPLRVTESAGRWVVALPEGRHRVRFFPRISAPATQISESVTPSFPSL